MHLLFRQQYRVDTAQGIPDLYPHIHCPNIPLFTYWLLSSLVVATQDTPALYCILVLSLVLCHLHCRMRMFGKMVKVVTEGKDWKRRPP